MNFEIAFYIAAAGCVALLVFASTMYLWMRLARRRSLRLTERRNRDEIFLSNLGGALTEARRAMDSHGPNREQATKEMERYLTNLWQDERRQRHRREDGPPAIAESLRSLLQFCTSVKLAAPEELSQSQ